MKAVSISFRLYNVYRSGRVWNQERYSWYEKISLTSQSLGFFIMLTMRFQLVLFGFIIKKLPRVQQDIQPAPSWAGRPCHSVSLWNSFVFEINSRMESLLFFLTCSSWSFGANLLEDTFAPSPFSSQYLLLSALEQVHSLTIIILPLTCSLF